MMIQSEEYDDEFYEGEEENSHPCWSCGGSGGYDGEEEDPLWYNPGDFIKCDVCNGKGYLTDDDE